MSVKANLAINSFKMEFIFTYFGIDFLHPHTQITIIAMRDTTAAAYRNNILDSSSNMLLEKDLLSSELIMICPLFNH